MANHPTPKPGLLQRSLGSSAPTGTPTVARGNTVDISQADAITIAAPVFSAVSKSIGIQVQIERARISNDITELLTAGKDAALQSQDPDEAEAIFQEASDKADQLLGQINDEDLAILLPAKDKTANVLLGSFVKPHQVALLEGRLAAEDARATNQALRDAFTAGDSNGTFAHTWDIIGGRIDTLNQSLDTGRTRAEDGPALAQGIIDSTIGATISGIIESDSEDRFRIARKFLEENQQVIDSMTPGIRIKMNDAVQAEQSTWNYDRSATQIQEGGYPDVLGDRGQTMFKKWRKEERISQRHWRELDRLRKEASEENSGVLVEIANARARCDKMGRSIWDCINPQSKYVDKMIETLFREELVDKTNDLADLGQPPPNTITFVMDFIKRSKHIPESAIKISMGLTQSSVDSERLMGIQMLDAMDRINPGELQTKSLTPHSKVMYGVMMDYRTQLLGSGQENPNAATAHFSIAEGPDGPTVKYNLSGAVPIRTPEAALGIAWDNLARGMDNEEGARASRREKVTKISLVNNQGQVDAIAAINQVMGHSSFAVFGWKEGDLDELWPWVNNEAIEIMVQNPTWPKEAAYESAVVSLQKLGWNKDEFNGRGPEVLQAGLSNPILRSTFETTVSQPNGTQHNMGAEPHRSQWILTGLQNLITVTDNPAVRAVMEKTHAELSADGLFLTGHGVMAGPDSGFPRLHPGVTNNVFSHMMSGVAAHMGFSDTRDAGFGAFWSGKFPDQPGVNLAGTTGLSMWSPNKELIENYEGFMEFKRVEGYNSNERMIELLSFNLKKAGLKPSEKMPELAWESELWRRYTKLYSVGNEVPFDIHWEFGASGDDQSLTGRKANGEKAPISVNLFMIIPDNEDVQINLSGLHPTTMRYDPLNMSNKTNQWILDSQPDLSNLPPGSDLNQLRLDQMQTAIDKMSDDRSEAKRKFDPRTAWGNFKRIPEDVSKVKGGLLKMIDEGGSF